MGSRMTPVTDTTGKDDAVGTHKIRTTITPGEVISVDDAVLLDLERQGLVLSAAESAKRDEAEAAAAAKAAKDEAAAAKAAEKSADKKGE